MGGGGIKRRIDQDRTSDGMQGVGVPDFPEAGLVWVADALRLHLCREVGLNRDKSIAVRVLGTLRKSLHIHLQIGDRTQEMLFTYSGNSQTRCAFICVVRSVFSQE